MITNYVSDSVESSVELRTPHSWTSFKEFSVRMSEFDDLVCPARIYHRAQLKSFIQKSFACFFFWFFLFIVSRDVLIVVLSTSLASCPSLCKK